MDDHEIAERAKMAVKRAVEQCRQKYGSGWEYLSSDQRRGAVCLLVMVEMAAAGARATSAALLVAIANETVRTEF